MALGAPIVAIDIDVEKLTCAKEIGATVAVDASGENFLGADLRHAPNGGFDHVIAAAGSASDRGSAGSRRTRWCAGGVGDAARRRYDLLRRRARPQCEQASRLQDGRSWSFGGCRPIDGALRAGSSWTSRHPTADRWRRSTMPWRTRGERNQTRDRVPGLLRDPLWCLGI